MPSNLLQREKEGVGRGGYRTGRVHEIQRRGPFSHSHFPFVSHAAGVKENSDGGKKAPPKKEVEF